MSLLQTAFSQQVTDYAKVRPDLIPSLCGELDSLSLTELLPKAEAFDTSAITKNLYAYYEDLGLIYYSLFLYTNDPELIRKAIAFYDKALCHDPKSFSALWNSIFAYSILGDCPHVRSSIARFKSRVKKKYWSLEELEPMLKACEGR